MRRVEALVLAAGFGSRFAAAGGGSKLDATLGGKPLVRHVVETALASKAARTIVVTGHAAETVRTNLADLDLLLVANDRFADGLSTSLRCGLQHVAAEAEGIVVLLGDMPCVAPAIVDALIDRFQTLDADRVAVVPTFGGVWGNPVLVARALFPALARLEGDRGARSVLEGAPVELLPTNDRAVLLDVDTPVALAALRGA